MTTRGGYFLGMALSSPWSVAFWIAVVGNTQSAEALSLGRCVVLGACAWGLVLSSAVRMGARFATPLWDAITQDATSALMLAFAARGLLRMVSS